MRRIAGFSLVLGLFLFVLPVVSAQHVWAQATLENPQPGSFQSGIGVIYDNRDGSGDHLLSHPGNDASSLYNFYEATGGQATIIMDGLSEFLLPD